MSFWEELRRRNVFKVGAAYAIVAWLLIQLWAILLPTFRAPEWVMPVFTALVILGFPLALLLAWAYEITAEGIKKTAQVPPEQSTTHLTGQKLNYLVTGLLVLAVAFMAADTYLIGDSASDLAPPGSSPQPTSPSRSVDDATANRQARPKVAVLPCDNLSPDPNDAFVAASIHEEILNQVAKLSSLLVVARTSVMQYEKARPSVPQIARELSATAVMECSVRYAGDAILVTAQLIDPETDSHLWSDTYPGSLSDVTAIFGMQADIAMSIANALDAEFSQAEQARIEKVPTTSAEAYSLYLKARDLSRTAQADGAQESIRLLEEAIRVDSQFALAHAVLAGNLTFGLINGLSDATGDWREFESRAIEHAERALRLDPDIGLAYDALGLLYRHTWRWPEALEAFESALELSPNDPIILADFGWLNSFRGAHRESLRMAERRLELEPGVASAYSSLGFTHAAMGNVEAAASAHRQALLLNPTEFPARQHLGVMQALLGNGGAAEAEFRTLEGQFGGKLPLALLPELAMGYSMIGLDDDARRLVDEILSIAEQREVGAGTVAMAYLAVRERDKAIAQLQIATDRAERREPDGGFLSLMIIKNNMIQNAMLEEPQFRDLRARLGGI